MRAISVSVSFCCILILGSIGSARADSYEFHLFDLKGAPKADAIVVVRAFQQKNVDVKNDGLDRFFQGGPLKSGGAIGTARFDPAAVKGIGTTDSIVTLRTDDARLSQELDRVVYFTFTPNDATESDPTAIVPFLLLSSERNKRHVINVVVPNEKPKQPCCIQAPPCYQHCRVINRR